jgi:hypothetical protein
MAFALAGLVQVLPKAFHPSLINLLRSSLFVRAYWIGSSLSLLQRLLR